MSYTSDRMRSNVYRSKERNLYPRKEVFTVKVVRHWNSLSREVLDAPSLAMFMVRLDKALNNLLKWELFLPLAGQLGLDIFKVHSNSLKSYGCPILCTHRQKKYWYILLRFFSSLKIPIWKHTLWKHNKSSVEFWNLTAAGATKKDNRSSNIFSLSSGSCILH